MHKEMSMRKLEQVLAKYSSHPDFLGINLVDPNQRGAVDDTPLHIASRKGELEDVQALLASGADLDISGDLGYTPLHCAAMCGKVDVIKQLLLNGANLELTNEFNQTPLNIAELGGHKEIVEILSSWKPT